MINPDSPDRAEILTARLLAWHLSGEQVPETSTTATWTTSWRSS
jgi:hypothetical protein